MLLPAQEGDLPFIRALIREHAHSGSFEEELASDSAESELFFARFADVVSRKTWTRAASPDSSATSAAAAFVFRESALSMPVGFVAIRSAASFGYELWLTALQADHCGRGLGCRMLTEFFATPEGKATSVAQCRLGAPGPQACAHLLAKEGFVVARVGLQTMWRARASLPAELLQWMKTAPFVSLE
jgi:hypothetical protein